MVEVLEIQPNFDYELMEASDRAWLGQVETELTVLAMEAKSLAERYAHNVVKIGERLAAVRDRLKHNKCGGFTGWLHIRNLGRSHAYKCIDAWEKLGQYPEMGQFDIAPSELWLLLEMPADNRAALMSRVEQGAPTEAIAQEIRATAVVKPVSPIITPEPPPPIVPQRGEFAGQPLVLVEQTPDLMKCVTPDGQVVPIFPGELLPERAAPEPTPIKEQHNAAAQIGFQATFWRSRVLVLEEFLERAIAHLPPDLKAQAEELLA